MTELPSADIILIRGADLCYRQRVVVNKKVYTRHPRDEPILAGAGSQAARANRRNGILMCPFCPSPLCQDYLLIDTAAKPSDHVSLMLHNPFQA